MTLRATLLSVLLLTPLAAGAQLFTLVEDPAISGYGPFSYSTTWVDIDGDLDLDLSIGNPSANFAPALFLNNGDGTFTNPSATLRGNLLDLNPSSHGQSWADIDNDGDLDVCLAGSPMSSILRNDGDGVMTRIGGGGAFQGGTVFGIAGDANSRGWSCAWGDYDNDGFVDLFIAHPAGFVSPGAEPVPNSLYRNLGGGLFTEVTDTPITDGLAPFTVGRWMDVDRDGDQDLFVGSGPATGTPGPDFLYRNLLVETGTASFERIEDGPFATDRDGQVWNLIDYDNDGDLDAFVTNYGSAPANQLYRNDGGTYSEVTTEAGALTSDLDASLSNLWGDYDNDGDLDVFVSNEGGSPNRYYENSGAPDYTFTETGAFASVTVATYGASAGDYDADGDLDLSVVPVFPGVAGPQFTNQLYRTDAPADHHWLHVKLDGTSSNRAGLHAVLEAQVILNGTLTPMTREVSAQDAFNGHNALDVHFGLGDATQVEQLTIRWPSGTVDMFSDVSADQFLLATEGGALVPVSASEGPPAPAAESLRLGIAPNPAHDMATVRYTLPEAGAARIAVYDMRGREVAVLLDGNQSAGDGTVLLDGTTLPAGTYLVRLQHGTQTQAQAVTLVR